MRPKGKIENLPKWAQDELRLQELRLREANKRIRELIDSEPTDVVVDESYGHDLEQERYLPNNSRVRWYLTDGRGASAPWIEVRKEGDWLYVMSDGSRRELAVKPASSNVIRIGEVDRD